MASASQSLIILTIIALLVSGMVVHASLQSQDYRWIDRQDLPHYIYIFFCWESQELDRRSNQVVIVWDRICSPYIPSKRPIGSKGRGWSIRLAAGLQHASIFVSSHACIVWSCNEDLCRPSLMLNNQCNMQLVIYTVFYIADYILFHQSPPIPIDSIYISLVLEKH